MMRHPISRRQFVKTSSIAASGLALGSWGCQRAVEPGAPPSAAAIQRFKGSLQGPLILPDQQEYGEARRVWNGLIDRQPWGVARCADASDVRRCIAFAGENGLPIAVRGGGHHAAGFAVVENGVVIDLSEMTNVRVDAASRTATAGPGATAGLLHRETQASGLVLPTGTVSTVGLAGLTLGGGEGWLTSMYGLTCDNLVSVEVVTAAGDVVGASESENSDLLWGLRGGGGNFGVVTSFEYRLHELSQVTAGTVAYPVTQAGDAIRHWRDRMANAPDELGSMVFFVAAPQPMFLVGVCYAGSEDAAGRVLNPLQSFGSPLQVSVGRMSVLDLNTMFDAGSPPGASNYWRSHYLRELPDDAIDTFIENCGGVTSPQTMAWLVHYHGAFGRVPEGGAAYPHRETPFELGISARWPAAAEGDPHIEWARRFWTAMAPFSSGGVYVNWSSDVAGDSSSDTYRANLPRLQDLKRRYDPTNAFRSNFNVEPS